MLEFLQNYTALSENEIVYCCCCALFAGVVRGFAGFGLSAVVMASMVVVLPPVQLFPICYVLEGVAGLAMVKNGFQQANRRVAFSLAFFSAVGLPIGLLATVSLDVEVSKIVAIGVIMALTALQFLKISPAFMETKVGLYGAGFMAGIATGLASVGGMVVALYVLSIRAESKTMRATLVLYLFIGLFTSLITLLSYQIIDAVSMFRAVMLVPFVLAGVGLGAFMFRPSLAPYYRPFCLALLIMICLSSLARIVLA